MVHMYVRLALPGDDKLRLLIPRCVMSSSTTYSVIATPVSAGPGFIILIRNRLH
jgi:hypothetical protein